MIALIWFWATWVVALDISNAFDRVKNADYPQKLSLTEFLVRYLVLFLFFSVITIDGFKWFWMGSLHKNIQLMLYFLKAPFLALHLSKYTLMIFMMLCVILLSMPMILLSNLTVIRHMICGNNYSWTWIWSMRNCGLGQEVTRWFQCWKDSTGFI